MNEQYEAEYSERLKSLLVSSRNKLNFSQEELASALGVGVATIRRWETNHVGKSLPIDTLYGLSRLIDRPLADIILEIFGEKRPGSLEESIFKGSSEKLERLQAVLGKNGEFDRATSKRLLILSRIFAQSETELLQLEMYLAALRTHISTGDDSLSAKEVKEIRSELEEAMSDWRTELLKQDKKRDH
jgi:transcriptional regulator with XRE-family HTH domain